MFYTVFLPSLSYQNVLRSWVYVISRNALNISYVARFTATYFTLPTVSFSPQRQRGLFIQPVFSYLAFVLKTGGTRQETAYDYEFMSSSYRYLKKN